MPVEGRIHSHPSLQTEIEDLRDALASRETRPEDLVALEYRRVQIDDLLEQGARLDTVPAREPAPWGSVWTTRQGFQLRVELISDSHLVNIRALVERRIRMLDHEIQAYTEQLGPADHTWFRPDWLKAARDVRDQQQALLDYFRHEASRRIVDYLTHEA